MKNLLIVICTFLVCSCGQSQEEKEKIAAVACSIMGETRNMDSAIRVREMNDAREKIGGEPFLRGDSTIQEAFKWGLCLELVLNENYDETLQPLKDAKREKERIAAEKQRIAAEKRAEERRIAAEKRAEEKRIAAEKRAEEKRIAAEKRAEEERIAAEKRAEERRIAADKQRIADSKPTVKEEFHSNGKLKSRTNFQPKSDGGKKHGLSETYQETGEIRRKWFYKNGNRHGLQEQYFKNGQVWIASNFVDGLKEGIEEWFHSNGKVSDTGNWKDGKKEGLHLAYYKNGKLSYKQHYVRGKKEGIEEGYRENGRLRFKLCYINNRKVDMNNCQQ
jgi:antitoxin component YwqK of YwqJK toxin-antitoxin module